MIENYIKLSPGHWFQECLTGEMPDYSSTYSKQRYDTYTTNDIMSKVRFDTIVSNIGDFDSICDFGYGNGSFMNYCKQNNKKVYGYDISDYPVPEGTTKINDHEINNQFDIMTFFDSIEHLPTKYLEKFLRDLNVKHVCISVPWFHESLGSEWFRTWKHRRQNEHLHHFDCNGLMNLLTSSDFKIVSISNNEDQVRKTSSDYPNILTIVATKKYA